MLFDVFPRPRYLRVRAKGREGVVIFPTYVPGSYLVRDLERHLVDIEGIGISKNRFYVREEFWYTVYTSSKDQREALSTGNYIFVNPPAVFPFQDWNEKYCVRFHVDWPIHTTLRKEGEYYCSDDYESFSDSPIQASPDLKLVRIDDYHYVSSIDDLDPEKLRAVIREIDDRLGQRAEYIFFFRRSDKNYGGIEHLKSSSIVVPWDRKDLVVLFAHEYLHRWNVKTFRPKDLELDMEKEVLSDMLWFAEGVTDYMALVSAVRVGAVSTEEAGKYLANAMAKMTFPGARRTSLAEASRTTWIKYYKQDENFLNSSVSYYDGGLLLGLILDAHLTRVGERIFNVFKNIPHRYTFDDLDRYFRAKGYVDLERLVYSPAVSLLEELKTLLDVSVVDQGIPYYGLMMDNNRVIFVEDDSPADVSSIIPNDTIVGVDGTSRQLEVKDEVNLTIVREGRLMNIKLRSGRSPGHKVRFRVRGELSQAIFNLNEWFGESNLSIL
jgi:Predicted protease with the C-terminal PDZ domain